jgi:hypothetical protein
METKERVADVLEAETKSTIAEWLRRVYAEAKSAFSVSHTF